MDTPSQTQYITITTPPSAWDNARVLLSLLIGALLGVSLARQDLSAGNYTDGVALALTYVLAIAASALSWASAPALVAVGVGTLGSAMGWELVIPLFADEDPLIGKYHFSHFGLIAGSAYVAAGLVIAIRHREANRDATESAVPELSPSQMAISAAFGLIAGVCASWLGITDFGLSSQVAHVGKVLLQTPFCVGFTVVFLGIAIRASRIGGGVMAVALVAATSWWVTQYKPLPDDIILLSMTCAAVIVSAVISLRSEQSYTPPTTTIAVKTIE